MGQHVSLKPALTGGWRVIHLATLPQTHKHLRNTDRQASQNKKRLQREKIVNKQNIEQRIKTPAERPF